MGWRQPWIVGALAPLTTPGHHIFYRGLRGRDIDLEQVERAWQGITDDRLQEYQDSVPHQWSADAVVADAISLIRDVRDHIDGALVEVRRVLT